VKAQRLSAEEIAAMSRSGSREAGIVRTSLAFYPAAGDFAAVPAITGAPLLGRMAPRAPD
jgi:hypothetical protein